MKKLSDLRNRFFPGSGGYEETESDLEKMKLSDNRTADQDSGAADKIESGNVVQNDDPGNLEMDDGGIDNIIENDGIDNNMEDKTSFENNRSREKAITEYEYKFFGGNDNEESVVEEVHNVGDKDESDSRTGAVEESKSPEEAEVTEGYQNTEKVEVTEGYPNTEEAEATDVYQNTEEAEVTEEYQNTKEAASIGEDENAEADDTVEQDLLSRREYRHKRRIRNQIIVYGVVAVFAVVIAAAAVGVGHKISASFKGKEQTNEQQYADNEQLEPEKEIYTEPEEKAVEAPPEIEEPTVDEQLEEIVSNCISVMPLEDKVAGLFIVTPEALTGVRTAVQAGQSTQAALSEYAVGGLIYFAQNIQNKEQITQMLSNTVSMSKYPIFLAIDEEGGTVSRLANSAVTVEQVGSMQEIGASGDSSAAYEAGKTIGSYLKEIGFNLDFAPVADLVNAGGNPVLGDRSFGSDPELCGEMVSKMAEGIQENSVSACLKHFPGIGSLESDTHEGRVELTKTADEMKNSDFVPFDAGIQAGVDFVMVSHVTASSIDTDGVPSSLSRAVVSDLLRSELGFEGVIITDALNMSAITDYYTSDEAAVDAVVAGADMLLMPEDFKQAYEGLLTAVRDGRISEERIDESLRRIYRIKYADKLEE